MPVSICPDRTCSRRHRRDRCRRAVRAEGQTVYLKRFTFEPGAEIFPHGHPGTTTLGVDSGSFGWTLLEGTARVVRGAGEEPAVVRGTLILTSGAQLIMPADMEMETDAPGTLAP